MLPSDRRPSTPPPYETLLVRIAQRADELTRERGTRGGLNLECWALAEREVMGPGLFLDLGKDRFRPAEPALRHGLMVDVS